MPADSRSCALPLATRLSVRLAALRESHLYRSLCPPSGIDLCSNDYLGLSQHPVVKSRMAAAVEQEGAGSTGSRLLRGERNCFTRVEQAFAAFKQTERSLYFSSGYLANLAVLTTFPEAGDVVFSDERNHASLIDGVRLSRAERVVFPHNDLVILEKRLREQAGDGQKFVVIESLFSMDGDEAPLMEYAALCKKFDAALIVDEAHAVGIYGERGTGLIEAHGISDGVFLSINTAGKALGVGGAFVAGSRDAIEYLIQRGRPFVFSTASSAGFSGGAGRQSRNHREGTGASPKITRTSRTIAFANRDRRKIANHSDRLGRKSTGLEYRENLAVGRIRCARHSASHGSRRNSATADFRKSRLEQGCAGALRRGVRKRTRSHMIRGLFITGTDTNVGKTVLCAALLHRYRGIAPLRYWKPVQTASNRMTNAEVRRLSHAAHHEFSSRRTVRKTRFAAPGGEMGRRNDPSQSTAQDLPGDDETSWIVEGAGGALVPLNGESMMADLIATLGLPVLIAARSGLGTINHTLLTIEALRARSLVVAGVVMIGDPNSDNAEAIEHYGRVPVIAQMPRLDPLTPESLCSWTAAHFDPHQLLEKLFL